MRPDLFTHLLTFDEALARVLAAAVPVSRTERVDLGEADGRVAAAPVVSPVDVPAFDRAMMDGYAVRAADLAGAAADRPARLRRLGEVFTGEIAAVPVTAGTCLAIATGAPLPAGADAVVMVERTTRDGDDVCVTTSPAPGQNVGRRGADLGRGEPIVAAGDVLTPARVGSLAAAGLTGLEVFERPTLVTLSTGNEVTAPGLPLPEGHVYDVNSFTIGAVARRHGARVTPRAATADDLAALTAALEDAAEHDVVVFSGGSSVGGRDLMLDAVQAVGTIDFHGIAVKPGKPTLFGLVGGTPVFGMPGNPTSCLSNAYLLLVPFLRRLARLPAWTPRRVEVPLARPIRSVSDRHQFYPVRLTGGRAEPAFKSSSDITSLARADGYIEIAAGDDPLAAGTPVTVTFLE